MTIRHLLNQTLLTTLLKIALILTIAPFLIIALFSQPLGDDICVAVGALKLGFWNYQAEMYHTWTGRYFSWAAVSLYPFVADLVGPESLTADFFNRYPVVPILVLIALFLSIFVFVRVLADTLSPHVVSNRNIVWATIFLVALYLNAMPSPAEGIYWLSGSGTYTFPSALLLLLLSLLLLPFQRSKPKGFLIKAIYVTVCISLTIAIVGSNEIFALILLIISLLIAVGGRYFREPASRIWSIVFVTTMLATAVSFLAPGNSARKLLYEARGTQPSAVFLAIRSSYNFVESLGSWIADPVLLGATLLLLPTAIALGNQSRFFRHPRKSTIAIISIAVWLILILATFFLPYFAGGYPAKRVSNVVYLIFLLGWFLNLFLLVLLFLKETNLREILPDYLLISAKVVMIIGLLCRGNFIKSVEDLVLYAPTYRSQMNDRYALITRLAANQKQIEVPALTKYPPTIVPLDAIQGQDISEDANYIYNTCSASFFNLESIVIQPKSSNRK